MTKLRAGPDTLRPPRLAGFTALGKLPLGAINLIDPKEIEICTRADGTPWLLGSGSFGQVVRPQETLCPSHAYML